MIALEMLFARKVKRTLVDHAYVLSTTSTARTIHLSMSTHGTYVVDADLWTRWGCGRKQMLSIWKEDDKHYIQIQGRTRKIPVTVKR